MLLLGPKALLFLTALIIPSDWTPLGVSGQGEANVTQATSETFTDDPNLVNEPSTDETVLADIEPSTDDQDEFCRQMAGLPPRRLQRSNYFRLPPCENVNLQRPVGL
ncbi:microfibril associated protein 5 [Rhinolophus ferrumequinum]|uniref:Microfibril associated protein 5 n=1 Tax=Rhinolophus ferrumequinum TaxID=59479 RepID=A0A671E8F1_RHIFE|nr:microfibril associated protein 5 [Rhinolophus ferrumequinum]